MKRLIGLCLTLALLAGCMSPAGLVNPALESPTPAAVTLWLPRDADEVLEQAASLLAQKAQELSNNSLTVTVEHADDPYASMADGLAFVSLTRLGQAESRLTMLSRPFFFNSASQLELSLNSPRSQRLLERLLPRCGNVVGALYGGSMNLLTTKKFYDELGVETYSVSLQDPGCYNLFQTLKARTVALQSFQEGLAQTADKSVTALEIRFPQLAQVTVENVKLNFIPTRHYLYAHVLLAGDELTQRLSPHQMAAIEEAFAYVLPKSWELRGEYEAKQLLDAKDRGVVVYQEDYPSFRRSAEQAFYTDITSKGWNSEVYSVLWGTGR